MMRALWIYRELDHFVNSGNPFMLILMRNRVGKIVIKAFAFVLILAFGAWGVQDMLGYQGGGGGAVAEVGGVRLGPNQFYREVNEEVTRMRPLFGGRLNMGQAQQFGFVDRVLNRQINDLATNVSAEKLGIAISDGLVRSNIVDESMFKGLAGNFDRQRFQQILQNNGLSEDAYVARLRNDLASQHLLGTITSGAVAPKAWVNAVFRFREEKRTVDSVSILDQASGVIANATDSQLRAHYDGNKKIYTAPEYRSLTYVNLSAAELSKEIAISDNELREEFDRRADEFTIEETRKVRQMIVADEIKAKSAATRIIEGADFLVVAKEVANQDAAAVELGEISKSDLLPELADPVFGAKSGGITQPVKTALGWHVFQITSVTPGGAMKFEDAKPKLKSEMAHEKAIDGLFELSNKLEDSLGGGATLEEAASTLALKVQKIDAIDKQGLDRKGTALQALPGGAEFVNTAFATEESTESPLTEASDSGFYVLRINKVSKPALRPFEEVQAKVSEAWKAEQRRVQSQARAKTIVDAINAGKSLADAIAIQPIEIKTSKALSRDGRGGGADFNAGLTADVFKLFIGKAAMGRVGKGYRVAVLKAIAVPDPAADKKTHDELTAALSQSLQGDIAGQLRTAYREEAGVIVYQQTIDQLFGEAQRRQQR
jgi:peptidyl-prolyl cis-trans isomerase D